MAQTLIKVLVVEDSADGAKLLEILFRTKGCEVSVAHTGQGALKAFTLFRPDLVFMDIGLPDIDGFQVCEQLRQMEGGETPLIVAQTGWTGQEHKDKAAHAGFDYHLAKPVNTSQLDDVLAAVRKKRAG